TLAQQYASPDAPNPALAWQLSIETMPAEYQRVLEAFGAFSPLGTNSEALQTVLDALPPLVLQRGLSYLKKRELIHQAYRFGDRYIVPSLLYRQINTRDPHTLPNGDKARGWMLRYAEAYTYEEDALFAAEHHLR